MATKRVYRKKKVTRRKKATRVAAPLVRRVVMNMAEKKYFEADIMTFASPVPATWAFASALAGIQQGTAATNRIGNKIFVHTIRFLIGMRTPATVAATTVSEQCRCVIYHNKEAVGTLPVGVNGVFTHNGISSNRFQPLVNRYSLLRDGIHTFSPLVYNSTTNQVALGPPIQYVWTINPRKRIDFQSNSGTISDLYKDDYGVGCVTSGTGGVGTCEMLVRVQVVFSDA